MSFVLLLIYNNFIIFCYIEYFTCSLYNKTKALPALYKHAQKENKLTFNIIDNILILKTVKINPNGELKCKK